MLKKLKITYPYFYYGFFGLATALGALLFITVTGVNDLVSLFIIASLLGLVDKYLIS